MDHDISGYLYTIKIVDIGDEEAYIKVKTNPGSYFYPSKRVIFDESDLGATFQMLSKNGTHIVEEIFIPHFASGQNTVYGDYADRGDSRGIICELSTSKL